MLAVIAATLVFDLTLYGRVGAAHITLYFFYCVAVAWLAVAVHRMVLVEGADNHARLDSAGLKRLGRFVGTMIGLWLLYAALIMLLMSAAIVPFSQFVPEGVTPPPTHLPNYFPYIDYAIKIVALWPVARLSLLFPALATDQRFEPIAAWQASRHNGWKLMIIVGALPWAFRWISSALHRDDATWVEFGVLVVISAAFTIFQVVALSLSYWELTRPEPPPTPPPV